MDSVSQNPVIQILADGKFHSGQAIADKLQMSRTAVWKKIQSLKVHYGLTVNAVSGKGYWLPGGLDLLNKQTLAAQLKTGFKKESCAIHVFDRIDSTNQYMLDESHVSGNHWEVCVAEMQTRGRGRRGRQWISPYAKNLQLSVGFMLNMPMNAVSGLSIAAGVTIAGFLSDLGVAGVALKWPNDIHVNQSKIAGLLLEVRGEAEGPVKTVLGIGLNLDMSGVSRETIGQPFTDIKHHLKKPLPSRTNMVVSLVRELHGAIENYQQKGLGFFLKQWERFDWYLNKEITISSADNHYHGRYIGLDEQGRLMLEADSGIKAYSAGEVSLRGQVQND